jgi:hypothetical protein
MVSEESARPMSGRSVSAAIDQGTQALSLRYFLPDGPFADAVRLSTELSLPIDPCTVRVTNENSPTLLVWRSPTESLLLTRHSSIIEILSSAAARLQDGCVVDLTGGTCVLSVHGTGVDDLLARIGCHGSAPPRRTVRSTRVADLPVILIRGECPDVLLLVDRVYLDHLMSWMRVTIDDLITGPD